MREGWRETTLGEALTRTTVSLGERDEPPILTVTEGNGLIDQVEHWGRRVASENVSKYKVVQPDAIVYNVYLLWLGAIGRNATGEIGITSPVYEVFEVAPTVDPRYVEHLVTSEELRAAYAGISSGTVPRRRRTPWQAFLQVPIVLPPLDEQRRIVDLIAALDNAVDAAEAEAATSGVVRLQAIDALLELHGGAELMELGQLGSFERGKRFTKKDYVSDGLGCIHYGQIYTDYGATASETISFLPSSFRNSARLAHTGDLVIAGTGENVEDIGKAVAWMGRESVAVHDDAFIFRHELDPVFASALFSSSVFLGQRAPSDSKVARLSAGSLARIRVPVVSEASQRRIGALMIALDESVVESRACAEALRAVRSNLLSVLLSGEHEIPASYDALLEGEA